MTWPLGELDDVRRLRAVAASFPGVLLEETVLPSSFEDVWAVWRPSWWPLSSCWTRSCTSTG
ncbi:hypothetical protein [Actinomadura sp. 3N407]|uniref:hypothetical protein n=1 Tax=Actinomadura sp. 3N407 TaxID=3457423 RepID=UPI003FCEAA5C